MDSQGHVCSSVSPAPGLEGLGRAGEMEDGGSAVSIAAPPSHPGLSALVPSEELKWQERDHPAPEPRLDQGKPTPGFPSELSHSQWRSWQELPSHPGGVCVLSRWPA